LPVPDSQVRGELLCRFSVMPFIGSALNAGVAQQARSWLTPVQCYNKIPWDAMKLNRTAIVVPESYSLFTLPATGCQLSALKKAEDDNALIVRLFNPSDSENCESIMMFNRHQPACQETGMDEQVLEGGSNIMGKPVSLRPGQSRTWRIRIGE
jgi:mannosylglycerate hydrolase